MTNPAHQSRGEMRLGVYAEGTECFSQLALPDPRIFPISSTPSSVPRRGAQPSNRDWHAVDTEPLPARDLAFTPAREHTGIARRHMPFLVCAATPQSRSLSRPPGGFGLPGR
jgi:hypothetical protein